MRLWSNSFRDGGLIPPEHAFAVIDPLTHVRLSSNRNPHLAWDEVPHGTQSLALFCSDCDAPLAGSLVNQEDQTLAPEIPRREFFHWTLVDLPPALHAIGAAQFSELVTPHGKPGPVVPFAIQNGTEHQLRQGINDYTGWFANAPDMAGDYYGYDGPCPPWNDQRIHHYIFRLYALDLPRLALEGRFTGPQARDAIHGHILDEAQLVGAYSLNPRIASTLKK